MVQQSAKRLLAKVRLPFLRNVLVLSGGTLVSQIIGILAYPILGRLFSPTEIGLFGMYAAFGWVASDVSTLRYETAIVSAEDDQEAAGLTVAAITCSLFSSVILSVLLWAMVVQNILGFGALPRYAPLFALPSIFLTAAFTTLRYWFVRRQQFKEVAVVTTFQNSAGNLGKIAIGVLNLGTLGLFLGELLSRFLGVGRLARRAAPSVARDLGHVTVDRLMLLLRRHWRIPVFLLPSTLLNTLALTASLPLISFFYGPEAAGQFSMAQRVMVMPMTLIGSSVADAFHSRLSTFMKSEPSQVVPFFWKVAGGLLVVGLVPNVIVWFWGQPLFGFVLGREWEMAGRIAASIAPWMLAQFVVSPLSRVALVGKGQSVKLVYDVGSLVVVTGGFWVTARMGLTYLNGMGIVSAGMLIAYLVYLFLLFKIVRERR